MLRRLMVLLIVTALTVACTEGCAVLQPGVRLLEVRYTTGDTHALSTYYEDPDARPAADVWDYLAEVPVFADDASELVAADPADPLRAMLRGDVSIEVLHVDLTLRRARLKDVTLVRPSADAALWHLSAADMEAARPR